MGKHPKPWESLEARRLRRETGMPVKRIAAALGVSTSSVSYWVRDIKLTPEQRERNLRGPAGPQNPERIAARVAAIRETARKRRRQNQAEGRLRASEGDLLHAAGCMLYWAEGAKDRNQLKLCNSDPHMLVFFRRFLTERMGVDPARIRIRLHVYLNNGLAIEQIEDFWLNTLDLPRSSLRAHSINPLPTSSSGKKKDKLPYGVCTLTVNDTELIQHIYGAIQEYGGFEEPRWLDGPPRKPQPRPERRSKAA